MKKAQRNCLRIARGKTGTPSKKLLILGACGFIGRHMFERLGPDRAIGPDRGIAENSGHREFAMTDCRFGRSLCREGQECARCRNRRGWHSIGADCDAPADPALLESIEIADGAVGSHEQVVDCLLVRNGSAGVPRRRFGSSRDENPAGIWAWTWPC